MCNTANEHISRAPFKAHQVIGNNRLMSSETHFTIHKFHLKAIFIPFMVTYIPFSAVTTLKVGTSLSPVIMTGPTCHQKAAVAP